MSDASESPTPAEPAPTPASTGGEASGAGAADTAAPAAGRGDPSATPPPVPAADASTPAAGDAAAPPRRRRRRRRRRGEGGTPTEDGSSPESAGPAEPADTATGGAVAGASGEAATVAPSAAAGDPSASAAPAERPARKRRPRRRKAKSPGAASPPSPDAGGASVQKKAKNAKKAKKPKSARAESREPTTDGEDSSARTRRYAATAVRALSAMMRELLDAEGVGALARPRSIAIDVGVPLDARRDGAEAARKIVDQLSQRVHEVREHDRALVAGSVYSFFHESSEADGCRPTDPRHVFDGYNSTGRPQFADFVTLAIERKAPGIDELTKGADLIVAHVTQGRVLRTQQLVEFGKSSPTFKILGQVDAGLYAVARTGQQAAFSFQLLRAVALDGRPRLRVHAVGAVDPTDLVDPSVALILQRFQRRLEAESLRLAGLVANGGAVDEEEFATPLLQELAKQLAGRAKRAGRRTEHATERADQGQRPTTKAWEDAKRADDTHLFLDDVEGTIVVVGPRGRVHVFTVDARHVTSVMMTGANIRTRQQQGRWRPAEPEQRGSFRIAVRARVAADEKEPEAPPAGDA